MISPRERALRSADIGRILTFLEDLDGALAFTTRWQPGTVLGLKPGQVLDRWEMTVRISGRAEQDAEFRRELLQNPRYVGAIALRESLGVKPIDYLWQVKNVSVVEEAPGLHWLILPACHLGCGTPEVLELPPASDSCQVCGKPGGGCQQVASALSTRADRIHEVDEFVVRSVEADASALARLVAADTSTSLCLVLLARHEPQGALQ